MSTMRSLAVAVMAVWCASDVSAQSPQTAQEARNEAVIRQHHDAINRGDIGAAAAFYADTVRNSGNVVDRTRLFAIMQDNSRTVPDWRMTIDRLIARGDEVVVLMTVTGTHGAVSQRPVNGGVYLGVAPTGRSFSVVHTHWLVVKDGRIAEHRATCDDLGMSRQLGLLPPGPSRPPRPPSDWYAAALRRQCLRLHELRPYSLRSLAALHSRPLGTVGVDAAGKASTPSELTSPSRRRMFLLFVCSARSPAVTTPRRSAYGTP